MLEEQRSWIFTLGIGEKVVGLKEKEKMTEKQILKAIGNMENKERWILLNELYYKYFNKDGHGYAPMDFDY